MSERRLYNKMTPLVPHCPIHPDVALICPCCRPDLVIDRAKGGRNSRGVTSKAKAKASARNGRKGGRPPLPKHSAKCQANRLDTDATGDDFVTVGCPRCEARL
jgi:hypothetical protein